MTDNKHPGGRPLKFKTVKELETKIRDYFDKCDKRTSKGVNKLGKVIAVPAPKPYTITGLALALDTTRETLLDYEAKDEYSDAIRKAKLKCQNYAEESLWTPKISPGIVFNLKNNYGWKDKSEVDQNNTGEVTIKIERFDGNKTSS